jgi:hypothetical protein
LKQSQPAFDKFLGAFVCHGGGIQIVVVLLQGFRFLFCQDVSASFR